MIDTIYFDNWNTLVQAPELMRRGSSTRVFTEYINSKGHEVPKGFLDIYKMIAEAQEVKAEQEGHKERLGALQPGKSAKVCAIAASCRGAERRRFMDLGILPGTIISAEMRSPSGDPTAYCIRGALIALRREQADQILVLGGNS